jgi:small multidrug resistance pump
VLLTGRARGLTLLLAAIAIEVTGTTLLAESDGFEQAGMAFLAFAFWGVSLWLFAIALRLVPVAVAYALWSGIGTLALVLIGWLGFSQRPDAAALVGIALVLAGSSLLTSAIPEAEAGA